jgi:hypothetical protein
MPSFFSSFFIFVVGSLSSSIFNFYFERKMLDDSKFNYLLIFLFKMKREEYIKIIV